MNPPDPAAIRAYRLARGWSQVKLAKRLGVSVSSVVRYEHGHTPTRACKFIRAWRYFLAHSENR